MPQVRIGRVTTFALAGDRIMVYFENGSSARFIANNDITSSEVAVIGGRVFTRDKIAEVESDRDIFKSKTTTREEGGHTWAYLFNLYDHENTSIPYTNPTWVVDLLDACIRPMGDGSGTYKTDTDAYDSLPEIEDKQNGGKRKAIPFVYNAYTFRTALSGFVPGLTVGFPDPPIGYNLNDGYFAGNENFGYKNQFAPRPYALARRSEHGIPADYYNADAIGNPTTPYTGTYPDPEDSTVGELLFTPRYESIRTYWYQELWGKQEVLNPLTDPTVFFTLATIVPDEPKYKAPGGLDVEYYYEGDNALQLRPGETGLNSNSDHNIVAWGYLSASDAAKDRRTYVTQLIHCDIRVDIGHDGVLNYDSSLYTYNKRYNPNITNNNRGMAFHKNFTTGVESYDLGAFMSLAVGNGQAMLDELKLATQEFYDSFISQFNWNMPAFMTGGRSPNRPMDVMNNPDYVDPAVGVNIYYNLNILLERSDPDRKRTVLFVYDDYLYNADDPYLNRILDEPFYAGRSYVDPNTRSRPKGKRSLYVQVGNNQPRLLKEIPKTEAYDSHISPVNNGRELEVVIKTGKRGSFSDTERYPDGIERNFATNQRRPKYVWIYPDAQHVVPFHQLTSRDWGVADIYRISEGGSIISHITLNYSYSSTQYIGLIPVSEDNWQWIYISGWQDNRPDLHIGKARNAIDTNDIVQFRKITEARNLPSAYQGHYGAQIAYQRCVRYKGDSENFADRGLFNCTRYLIDLGTLTTNNFVYIDKNDISHVDDNLNVTLNLYRFHQGIDKPNWDSSIFKALIDGKVKNSVYYTVEGQHTGGSVFVGGFSTFEPSYQYPTVFPNLQIPPGTTYYDGAVDAIAYLETS